MYHLPVESVFSRISGAGKVYNKTVLALKISNEIKR